MNKFWPILLLLAGGCAAPIHYRYEAQSHPPNRIWIAEVNLLDPRVHVRVAPGGPDPDGPGRWQTTLLAPTKIAAREGFDLVVNGDFFDARAVKDAEGASSRYRADIWAAALGPAVTDGKAWAVPDHPRPCFIVGRDGRASIGVLAHPSAEDWEVVAGNVLLVTNGVAVPQTNKARHPRTAVGLDARGTRLTIVVADGRKPAWPPAWTTRNWGRK